MLPNPKRQEDTAPLTKQNWSQH